MFLVTWLSGVSKHLFMQSHGVGSIPKKNVFFSTFLEKRTTTLKMIFLYNALKS
jgi:hypothetical protein